MEINRMPPEVLGLILGQLLEYQLEDPDYDDYPALQETPLHYSHLREARLVCRQWNRLATTHLFRTLTLDADPDDGMWSKPMPFDHFINSETIQRAAQEVVIRSHPDALDMIDDASEPEGWVTEDDDLDSLGRFGVAVNGISKLPNLKALQGAH